MDPKQTLHFYLWLMERKRNGNRTVGEGRRGLSAGLSLVPLNSIFPSQVWGRTTPEMAFYDLLSHKGRQRICLRPASSKMGWSNTFNCMPYFGETKFWDLWSALERRTSDPYWWSCRRRRNGRKRLNDEKGSVRQKCCFRSPLQACLLWSHDF